ncbi:MAG: YtxH domain-containing protein [Methanobacteriaceae archaeon]|nr:YtxH domain-containing protein [Candidatus Methanorudis spinitermitis]
MGLLVPMIEKKDVLLIVGIGFVIGLVGGGFLIAPIYDELPYVVGEVHHILGENEVVYVEISTNNSASKIIKQIEEVDGVVSVENDGIFLETTNFSNERKEIIEDKIPVVDENFKSWEVDSSGKININITKGYDANNAIKTLSEWLVFTADIQTKYSIIKIKINVESSKINNLLNYLESNEIIISSVEGPIQKAIDDTKNNMPDRNLIIFFMGILGVIVALFGTYYDETINFLKELKEKIKNKLEDFKEEINEKIEDFKEEIKNRMDKD